MGKNFPPNTGAFLLLGLMLHCWVDPFFMRLSGIWNYAVLNQLSAWLLSLARCLQWIPIFLN